MAFSPGTPIAPRLPPLTSNHGEANMENITTIAASRLVAQSRAMDVTADNIANATTPGYKTARVQFSDWLTKQTGTTSPRGGASVAYTQDRATWRNHQPGPLNHTANPLDLAITGEGFFTVATPQGTQLTRAGRFTLSPDGTVINAAGASLLDTAGQPIRISAVDTVLTVAGDGTLSSEHGQIGKVGVVAPGDPMQLQAQGNAGFRSDSATSPVTAPAIVQGAVEDSNVQPVQEMVRMMNDLRQFQFVTQMVESEDQRQQSAIDKILQRRG